MNTYKTLYTDGSRQMIPSDSILSASEKATEYCRAKRGLIGISFIVIKSPNVQKWSMGKTKN